MVINLVSWAEASSVQIDNYTFTETTSTLGASPARASDLPAANNATARQTATLRRSLERPARSVPETFIGGLAYHTLRLLARRPVEPVMRRWVSHVLREKPNRCSDRGFVRGWAPLGPLPRR